MASVVEGEVVSDVVVVVVEGEGLEDVEEEEDDWASVGDVKRRATRRMESRGSVGRGIVS